MTTGVEGYRLLPGDLDLLFLLDSNDPPWIQHNVAHTCVVVRVCDFYHIVLEENGDHNDFSVPDFVILICGTFLDYVILISYVSLGCVILTSDVFLDCATLTCGVYLEDFVVFDASPDCVTVTFYNDSFYQKADVQILVDYVILISLCSLISFGGHADMVDQNNDLVKTICPYYLMMQLKMIYQSYVHHCSPPVGVPPRGVRHCLMLVKKAAKKVNNCPFTKCANHTVLFVLYSI